MKTAPLVALLLLVCAAALLGAVHYRLIELPALSAVSGLAHDPAKGVPFKIHYSDYLDDGIIDDAGKAIIDRALRRHRTLVHRADIYLDRHHVDDIYGVGRGNADDTVIHVSLDAVRDTTLNSRTETTTSDKAALTTVAAIERCVAAYLRSRTDPDLRHRRLTVLNNL